MKFMNIVKADEELKVLFIDKTMKAHSRNYYERKRADNGNHFYAYFEGNAYSFKFMESGVATDVVDEGPYKEFASRVKVESGEHPVVELS